MEWVEERQWTSSTEPLAIVANWERRRTSARKNRGAALAKPPDSFDQITPLICRTAPRKPRAPMPQYENCGVWSADSPPGMNF
jgi:hypothetical protein